MFTEYPGDPHISRTPCHGQVLAGDWGESGVDHFSAGTMKNTSPCSLSSPPVVMAEVCVDTREPQDRSTCIDGPLCGEDYPGESPMLTRHAAQGRNKPLLSEPLRCHG